MLVFLLKGGIILTSFKSNFGISVAIFNILFETVTLILELTLAKLIEGLQYSTVLDLNLQMESVKCVRPNYRYHINFQMMRINGNNLMRF